MIKKNIVTFTLVAVVASATFFTQPAQAQLTKEDVQKIVEEYIAGNGDKILKSVDDYQKKSVKAKTADALKTNHDDLFKDERSPVAGNPNGDVTVVEFFDFNCGYCKRAYGELKQLMAQDKKVKVIFKDLPILGPSSETASKWALAAQKQKKYVEFHDTMMEHQGRIDDAALEEAAKKVGMDVNQAKTDISSSEIMVQIERNRALASQMGISGTPAFVIGDALAPGAVPVSELKRMVDEARKNKK